MILVPNSIQFKESLLTKVTKVLQIFFQTTILKTLGYLHQLNSFLLSLAGIQIPLFLQLRKTVS